MGKLTDNYYLVNGSTPLSKFNEYFKTKIKSNDVDSITGYFITQQGTIPRPREQNKIKYGQYRLTANNIERTRLLNLSVASLTDQEESVEQ
nr:transporter associated domain-containing protein [Carnobacterium funditum]